MRFFFNSAFALLFIYLLSPDSAYSQKKLNDQQIADSIKSIKNQVKVLKSKKGLTNDSLRLELVNGLAVLYTKKSKDTALYYAQTALAEAKTLRLKNVTAVSLFNIASIYEYHKDMAMAEQNYLLWMDVRKSQSDDEYRWTLNEMRRFYLLTRQKEKLEKNEEEWLTVLDRQLDQGYICPWFDWEDPTPEDNYQYSMKPVFFELVGNDHYFLAEKSFLHIIKKCPSCYSDWETGDYIYSTSERRLLADKDTATLVIWYQHWYNALEQYGPGKKTSLETFSNIAQGFTSRYFSYDQYFDRFYPMMMSYTEKIGGDTAVHDLLLTSSRRYVASFPVKIKLNLLLLLSCIKVKDDVTIGKTYAQTDKLLKDYVSKGGSKYDLLMLLVAAKSKSDDKRYIKWCDKNIKNLR